MSILGTGAPDVLAWLLFFPWASGFSWEEISLMYLGMNQELRTPGPLSLFLWKNIDFRGKLPYGGIFWR